MRPLFSTATGSTADSPQDREDDFSSSEKYFANIVNNYGQRKKGGKRQRNRRQLLEQETPGMEQQQGIGSRNLKKNKKKGSSSSYNGASTYNGASSLPATNTGSDRTDSSPSRPAVTVTITSNTGAVTQTTGTGTLIVNPSDYGSNTIPGPGTQSSGGKPLTFEKGISMFTLLTFCLVASYQALQSKPVPTLIPAATLQAIVPNRLSLVVSF